MEKLAAVLKDGGRGI